MTIAHRIFIAASLFLFFVPDISLAATPAANQQALIAQLQAQIAQLQTELAQLQKPQFQGYLSASVTLPISQHVDDPQDGLRLTYMGWEGVTQPVASTSPFAHPLGVFLLDHSACATTYCQDPTHPTMKTELWPGQSTNYLNYTITLDLLTATSSSVTITKP